MKTILILIGIGLVIFVGGGMLSSVFAADTWTAFVYGDDGDLTTTTYRADFDSQEECLVMARSRSRNETREYECGKNCEMRNVEYYVCEETIDY